MRSKKAVINTIAGLLYELCAVVCGFILPRLILSSYGSDYNGVTSAITQFLGYVSLMKAGIGGVTKVALYKALARNDSKEISAVVNATNKFLKKVAVIFAISLIGFASIYPIFVQDNFEWFFTFSLVLIIGISTFAQYFFGLTYQLLFNADQRQCVIWFVQIATTIINTFIAAILIKLGATIHIVKLASSLVFCLNPLLINYYARKRYKIDKFVPPNNEAIKDRWDCFGLQVANFVNSNTDLFILTLFTNVYEVSVYTVYHMITNGIQKLMRTFVNGVGSAFGNMFAKGEMDTAKRNIYLYEQVTFALGNFLFSVTLIMIVSFVKVYTNGVVDVNYERPLFAYVYVIATLFGIYRIPYQSIVEAVGHFKQTRNGAFFEAFMNIFISVLLVRKFGLVGVAVGTLFATVFRTFQYCIYMSRYVIVRSLLPLLKRLILSCFTFFASFFFSNLLNFTQPVSYLRWAVQAIPVSCIAFTVCVLVEVIFYRCDLSLTLRKVRNVFIKKRK